MGISRFKSEKYSKKIDRRIWEPFFTNLMRKLKNNRKDIKSMKKDKAIETLLKDLIKLHKTLGWLNLDNRALITIQKLLKGDSQITEQELKELRINLLIRYAEEGIKELKEIAVDYKEEYADVDATTNLIYRLENDLEEIIESKEDTLDVSLEEIESIIGEIISERKRLESEGETMKRKGKSKFYFKRFIPSASFVVTLIIAILRYYEKKLDPVLFTLVIFVVFAGLYLLLEEIYTKAPKFAEELEE